MANITVRQPNGLLAIFSTASDHFIRLNLTEDEAITAYGELGEVRPIAEQKIKAGIEDRDTGDIGKKGNGLGRWKDCTDTIRQCQGTNALDKLNALLK